MRDQKGTVVVAGSIKTAAGLRVALGASPFVEATMATVGADYYDVHHKKLSVVELANDLKAVNSTLQRHAACVVYYCRGDESDESAIVKLQEKFFAQPIFVVSQPVAGKCE